MHSRTRVRYISIQFLLIILIFSIFSIVKAQNLTFHITDLNDEEISEITEGEFFKLSIWDPGSGGETPYLTNVSIEFDNYIYQIDDPGELILQAPEVNQDVSFTLIASKIGYNTTNTTITILDNESQDELPKLIIFPEFYTVDAGKQFAVFVKDEDENPVFNATVAIQSDVTLITYKTDDDGKAWLTAPENKETIKILAQKEGYSQGYIDIVVNINPPWWITFINSPYFPIVIAVIFLLFAIIYVNHRQKKSIYSRAKEISNEKTLKKYDSNEKTIPPSEDKEALDTSSIKETVRIQPQQDAKVEEIRISKPRKEKEVVTVKSEEDETEKVISRKKIQKRDYDWFEGTDDIRYEIDKLTGEVDEEGVDKWYEGVDDLKDKIDEKVKKKDKKKDKETEE